MTHSVYLNQYRQPTPKIFVSSRPKKLSIRALNPIRKRESVDKAESDCVGMDFFSPNSPPVDTTNQKSNFSVCLLIDWSRRVVDTSKNRCSLLKAEARNAREIAKKIFRQFLSLRVDSSLAVIFPTSKQISFRAQSPLYLFTIFNRFAIDFIR